MLRIIFRQIQAYLDSSLIYARYFSDILSHIDNAGDIERYLPIFGYILADSAMFRILARLDIFMYIKAYSKPWLIQTYSCSYIFTQFQARNSGITQ